MDVGAPREPLPAGEAPAKMTTRTTRRRPPSVVARRALASDRESEAA